MQAKQRMEKDTIFDAIMKIFIDYLEHNCYHKIRV